MKRPLESGSLPPDSFWVNASAVPQVTSSVDVADAKPAPEVAESSEGNHRRTLRGRFRTMMRWNSHGRTPHQQPLEESSLSTLHTTGTPSNEQPSTMSPAQLVSEYALFLSLMEHSAQRGYELHR